MHSVVHVCLHLQDLPLSNCHSFERGCSSEAPGSMDLPHLSAGTVLISSGAPMVQTPAFGAITLLTLPTSLSSPALGIDLSVELLVCGLTFMFRLS